MDEAEAKRLFRKFDFLSKLFIFFFAFLAATFFLISGCTSKLTENHYLCYGINWTSLLVIIPSLLLFIFPITAIVLHYIAMHYASAINNKLKSNFWGIFIITFIISFLWFGMTNVTMCGSRLKARDARRISDMRQIKAAQETYYQKYSRFANTQETLVNEGLINGVLVDPSLSSKYADFDGMGIEGSDANPQTWSVKAALEKNGIFEKEICDKSKSEPVYHDFYFCNEKECNYLNK
jgi:hypothetical protein